MARPNLISLFIEFELYKHDIAVVQRRGYRRERWTYARLAKTAFRYENELKERGIRTGDRVVLWGGNSAEWVAAFWGCLLRGAVAVPVDDTSAPEFAERIVQETSASLVIGSRERPRLKSDVPTLELEDLADKPVRGRVIVTHHHYGEKPAPLYQSLADEPITREHIAEILFTSGTTGEPRGVVLTHGNFLANLEPLERGIERYRKYERWFHPLRFVTLAPLSHVFGQFMGLFVPPLLGSAVVFEWSANPGEVIRAVKRERATALIAVPHMLDLLRGSIERELEARGEGEWFRGAFVVAEGRHFLRRAWTFRRIHRRLGWKFWAFISGGAALSEETEEFFRRIGYAAAQGYGMTETASLISLNNPFRAARGTVGKTLPGREFRVAEDGEILVRGENVASGYWEGGMLRKAERASATESATAETGGKGATANDGVWLHTGDIGEIDAEGNLRFRGRKKNVIVTPAGLNVYPEDLEAALRREASLRDCVVIPVARGGNAEACAVLLLEESAAAQPIVERANAGLAEYQRMRCWLAWPEADFPRTATGKPRLSVIAARATQELGESKREMSPEDGARSSSRGRSITELLGNFNKDRQGSAKDATLEGELNLSSLDRVALMAEIEEKFHVELDETAFGEAKTVADVERLVARPEGRRGSYQYPRWAQREPTRWLRLAVYYALVWPATQVLAHPRIIGRDNLRGVGGPVLIVANHITRRADAGLILAALPGRFRHRIATAIAGETLQRMRRPPSEWFFARRWAYQVGYWLAIALFNVFPLPQFSGFRESFRFAGESVDRGYSVLVFPEGEVTSTGEMATFQSGIGLLAQNLRIPVVPIRLDGVWEMKRQGRKLARRGEIAVRIGAPVIYAPGTPPDEIVKSLESMVRAL